VPDNQQAKIEMMSYMPAASGIAGDPVFPGDLAGFARGALIITGSTV